MFAAIQVALVLILLLCCLCIGVVGLFFSVFVCINSCYRTITRDLRTMEYELTEVEDYAEW